MPLRQLTGVDPTALLIRRVLFPAWVRKNASTRIAYLEQFERSQFLSADALRELQWTQFKAVLRHAFDHCAFYRRKLSAIGMNPEDVRSLDDVARVPPISKEDIQGSLQDFIAECRKTGTAEAEIEKAEKLGYDTGLTATHPFDPNWKLPVMVANFVLMGYGTGAIFGCPAHDQRDLDFARKYKLAVTAVVVPSDADPKTFDVGNEAYVGPGKLANSRFLDGMTVEEAKSEVASRLEKAGIGERTVNCIPSLVGLRQPLLAICEPLFLDLFLNKLESRFVAIERSQLSDHVLAEGKMHSAACHDNSIMPPAATSHCRAELLRAPTGPAHTRLAATRGAWHCTVRRRG